MHYSYVISSFKICGWFYPNLRRYKQIICGGSPSRIYIYIYIYIFNKFPDFFVQAFKIVVDSWKFTVIAIHLMRWLTNFYDVRFKWTAAAAIGIHPTKAWLSQLVNFKNAIWMWGHFRRTICNKIILNLEKCHRNVWNTSDCFSTILHESSISFWVT